MRYEWYDQASRFSRSYRDVAMAVDKLVNIPNRELLYDVYAYITDMRSTLALVNSYVKWLGMYASHPVVVNGIVVHRKPI